MGQSPSLMWSAASPGAREVRKVVRRPRAHRPDHHHVGLAPLADVCDAVVAGLDLAVELAPEPHGVLGRRVLESTRRRDRIHDRHARKVRERPWLGDLAQHRDLAAVPLCDHHGHLGAAEVAVLQLAGQCFLQLAWAQAQRLHAADVREVDQSHRQPTRYSPDSSGSPTTRTVKTSSTPRRSSNTTVSVDRADDACQAADRGCTQAARTPSNNENQSNRRLQESWRSGVNR